MKKSLVLAFAALALSAGAALASPVAAPAAGAATTQNGVQIAQAMGMPNSQGGDDRQAVRSFNDTSIPVTSGFSETLSGSGNAHASAPLLCGTCALVNETGGGQ